MNVLFVAERLGMGGGINYMASVARALQARGHRIRVAHSTSVMPPVHDLAGVTLDYVRGLDRQRPLDEDRGARALETILQRFRPDVLFVHWLSNQRALALLLESRIPTVRMFHDYSSVCLRRARQHLPGRRCQRPLGLGCLKWGCSFGHPRPGARLPRYTGLFAKLKERRQYQRFDLALAPSRYVASVLLKNGFLPERIVVLPLFATMGRDSVSTQDAATGSRYVCAGGKPTLLFCGQVLSGKGLGVLVRAMALLQSDCRLLVAGDGTHMPVVRRLANRLGVESRIEWRGWLGKDDMKRAYKSADIVVVPSIVDETFCIVGIEAMAFAKPVVAFDVGGISDWLRDGVTGLLVRQIGPRALARAIHALLHDDAARQTMGAAGAEVARTEYGLDRHIDHLVGHFSRLMARQGRQASAATA